MVLGLSQFDTNTILTLSLAPVISWGVYITHRTIIHGQWIKGHQEWTATAFAGVLRDLARVEENMARIEAKVDTILERLAVRKP